MSKRCRDGEEVYQIFVEDGGKITLPVGRQSAAQRDEDGILGRAISIARRCMSDDYTGGYIGEQGFGDNDYFSIGDDFSGVTEEVAYDPARDETIDGIRPGRRDPSARDGCNRFITRRKRGESRFVENSDFEVMPDSDASDLEDFEFEDGYSGGEMEEEKDDPDIGGIEEEKDDPDIGDEKDEEEERDVCRVTFVDKEKPRSNKKTCAQWIQMMATLPRGTPRRVCQAMFRQGARRCHTDHGGDGDSFACLTWHFNRRLADLGLLDKQEEKIICSDVNRPVGCPPYNPPEEEEEEEEEEEDEEEMEVQTEEVSDIDDENSPEMPEYELPVCTVDYESDGSEEWSFPVTNADASVASNHCMSVDSNRTSVTSNPCMSVTDAGVNDVGKDFWTLASRIGFDKNGLFIVGGRQNIDIDDDVDADVSVASNPCMSVASDPRMSVAMNAGASVASNISGIDDFLEEQEAITAKAILDAEAAEDEADRLREIISRYEDENSRGGAERDDLLDDYSGGGVEEEKDDLSDEEGDEEYSIEEEKDGGENEEEDVVDVPIEFDDGSTVLRMEAFEKYLENDLKLDEDDEVCSDSSEDSHETFLTAAEGYIQTTDTGVGDGDLRTTDTGVGDGDLRTTDTSVGDGDLRVGNEIVCYDASNYGTSVEDSGDGEIPLDRSEERMDIFDIIPPSIQDTPEDECMDKCRRLQDYMRTQGCGGIVQCRKRPVPKQPGEGNGTKCYAKAVARCG